MFPTKYKISGIGIRRNVNLRIVHRSTYDLLNFLGDVGGLDGILFLIGSLLLGSYT
jgi:hypothetical protein